MQQGLLKRVHPWCRTGKTELKFEPGKSAAADIQRLQLRRHKPQPQTVTGAGAKEDGRELSSRTPRIRVGVSSCCEQSIFPPTRCRSPEPPRNQTSARGLRPGTPPPHPPPPPPPGSAARYRLPGRWSRSPRPSRSHRPRLQGVFAAAPTPAPLRPDPAGAPAPLLAATAEPEEVRLESGPARGGAAGKGAAGWSRATRWGRPGRGPGEATLTWLLQSLARLTTINPLAVGGGW